MFGTLPPSRLSVYCIQDKLSATGSTANAHKFGRLGIVYTEENKQLVADAFIQSPKKSTRRASKEPDISQTSLEQLMMSVGLKPYCPRLIYGLLNDDPDRWLQSSKTMLNEISENRVILEQMVWSH